MQRCEAALCIFHTIDVGIRPEPGGNRKLVHETPRRAKILRAGEGHLLDCLQALIMFVIEGSPISRDVVSFFDLLSLKKFSPVLI